MVFSKKNAGKWVASKSGKVVATASKLEVLVRKIDTRKDKKSIRFDKVPPANFVGFYGV